MGKRASIVNSFNWNQFFLKLTYASLVVLALGIFTSVGVSALSHVLLFPSGIYFFSLWLKKRDFEVKKSVWALLLMAVICLLSVVFNTDIIERPLRHILKVKYFLIAFLSYFSFQYLKRDYLDKKKISWILNLFIIVTTIATISGVIASYTGFNFLKMKASCHEFRACGLYGMYMTYGYGIGFFMVLLTGAVIYREKLKEWISPWVLYSAWSINLVGLLLSYARGAWIGFLLAIPFFFFKRQKKAFILTGVVGFLAFGGVFIASQKVRDTVLKRQGSNEERLSFFQAAFKAASERPVLGYGYKNFELHSKVLKKRYNLTWQEKRGHAHNNYLEHLASTGVTGLLSLLIFCALWLKETYQENEMIFPFVLSFLISGMTQYTFGDGENVFFLLGIFSLF